MAGHALTSGHWSTESVLAAKMESMQKEAAGGTKDPWGKPQAVSMGMDVEDVIMSHVEDLHIQADKRQKPTRLNSSSNQC